MNSTTFTWAITNLERETADGFVFRAEYQFTGTDGTYRVSRFGNIKFERPDSLIPFEELTPELVSSWVESAVGEQQVNLMKESINLGISQQHSPPTITGLPWEEESEDRVFD
ncbi:hypothetical protein [Synechococcus phage DSL-LC02]|nr:hypothetical protein [Synechococcus phage DSL-LC02]